MTFRNQALKIAHGLFEQSRAIREGGQEVAPVAFFMVPAGDQLGIHSVGMTGCPDKDTAAAFMRQHARQVGARYVMHVVEAWAVESGDPATHAAAMSHVLSGGTLADFPGVCEQVYATVDGPDLNYMLRALIREDGSLGPTEGHDAPGIKGRFTNLSGQVP